MKVAIVGFGPMGKRHALAVGRAGGLELVAVADRRAEAFDSVSLPPGVACFRDTGQLLRETQPELIVVATNAPSHEDIVKLAVDHGVRAVLCEKPVANSLAAARSLEGACRLAGVDLAVNHCRRHVPAYGWLRERIASGDWGELRGARMSCSGIGLGCVTTHFIDLAAFLFAETFVRVTGWVDPERGPNPRGSEFHDPGGLILAEGAGGARFIFQQMEDASGPTSIVLDFTLARVVVEEREERVSVIRRDPSVKPGAGRPAKFEHEALPDDRPLNLDIVQLTTEVLRELAAGGPVTCTASNGYRALEVVVAAYLSHARGNLPVALPLSAKSELAMELPIT